MALTLKWSDDQIKAAFRAEYVRTDENGNLLHHSTEDIVIATVRALQREPAESAPSIIFSGLRVL